MATEQIKFAVRFSRSDLTTLSPGDLLNLRDELEHFVVQPEGQPSPIVGSGVSRPFPQDYSLRDFGELQRDVKAILEQATRQETNRYGDGTQFPTVEFTLIQPSSGPKYIYATGSTRDIFLIKLFFLLAQEGVDNIKICPECEAIFYREMRRQKYCSRRCANLASVKRFQRKKAKRAKKGKKK